MTLAVLLGAALAGLWLLRRRSGDTGVVAVTGIPPTEARALASRSNDDRAEQRATSTFVPRFPQAPARESERP